MRCVGISKADGGKIGGIDLNNGDIFTACDPIGSLYALISPLKKLSVWQGDCQVRPARELRLDIVGCRRTRSSLPVTLCPVTSDIFGTDAAIMSCMMDAFRVLLRGANLSGWRLQPRARWLRYSRPADK